MGKVGIGYRWTGVDPARGLSRGVYLALPETQPCGDHECDTAAELWHRLHVAYAAGVKAAHEGRTRAPATDRAYMELIEARPRPVGEGDAAELAREWLAGYDYVMLRSEAK